MALYDVSTTAKKAAPSLVAGGTLYADSPIGTILPYGGASAPSGWFLCDGTAISRTTYAELFAVIGTAFGVGDGSTTFNLPDMREAVPKGAGLTGHTVGAHVDAVGLTLGEFLDDRVQSHIHNVSTTPSSTGASNYAAEGDSSGTHQTIRTGYQTSDSRSGDTTEVKSVGVNYIIKAKMVGVPADFLAKVQPKTLDTPLTIGGVSQTTVEGVLRALLKNDEYIYSPDTLNANEAIPSIYHSQAWYVGSTATNFTNFPIAGRNRILVAYRGNTVLTQLCFSETVNLDHELHYRVAHLSSGAWNFGDWQKLVTESDITCDLLCDTFSNGSGDLPSNVADYRLFIVRATAGSAVKEFAIVNRQLGVNGMNCDMIGREGTGQITSEQALTYVTYGTVTINTLTKKATYSCDAYTSPLFQFGVNEIYGIK